LELQLLFFFTRNTCHFPSDLASALSQFAWSVNIHRSSVRVCL
jgi:hypothetical protein